MLPLSGTTTPPGTPLPTSGVWTLSGIVILGTPGIGIFVPGIMLPPVCGVVPVVTGNPEVSSSSPPTKIVLPPEVTGEPPLPPIKTGVPPLPPTVIITPPTPPVVTGVPPKPPIVTG